MINQTTAEVLREAEQSGMLKKFLEKGLLPACVVQYREIYLRVLVYIDDPQKPTMPIQHAVTHTATDFKLSEKTIWRAWKKMKE